MFATRPYFVMIHSQSGDRVLPLVDSEGEVVMFGSTAEAADAAEQNPMACAFGWDVFMVGGGSEV